MAAYIINTSSIYNKSNIDVQITRERKKIDWTLIVNFMLYGENKDTISNLINNKKFQKLEPKHALLLNLDKEKIKDFNQNDSNAYIMSSDDDKYKLYIISKEHDNKVTVGYIMKLNKDTILCPNFVDKINSWCHLSNSKTICPDSNMEVIVIKESVEIEWFKIQNYMLQNMFKNTIAKIIDYEAFTQLKPVHNIHINIDKKNIQHFNEFDTNAYIITKYGSEYKLLCFSKVDENHSVLMRVYYNNNTILVPKFSEDEDDDDEYIVL